MDLALFVLRVVVGLLFVGHGTQKLFGFFGGGGLEGTAGFFEQLGLRPARLHAMLAGLAEAGGGLLLALGLVVPFGAAAVTAVMATAVITVHARNGIWVTENGIEYTLVMAATAFALAGVGAGSWSLDEALGIHLAGAGWAIGAFAVGVLGAIAAVIGGRSYQPREAVDGERVHPA